VTIASGPLRSVLLTGGPFVRCRPGHCTHQSPCKRCQASGTPCIFEKPEKKNVQAMSTASIEYSCPLSSIFTAEQ